MTCRHCVDSVATALRALPLVDDVQVDLVAGGISTLAVTGTASPEQVQQAIEEAGYTVLS